VDGGPETKDVTAGRRDTSQTGLTLLELMVALAIFSIVGAALYSTFTATLTGRERAVERAHAYSLARGVLDRMESDLRASIDVAVRGTLLPRFVAPGSGSGFASRRGFVSGRSSMIRDDHLLLDLTTLSARGVTAPEGYVANDELAATLVDRGDQARVVWRYEDADTDPAHRTAGDSVTGSALVRYEMKPPRSEEFDPTHARRQVVADHVSVRLDFYDEEQWGDVWDSAGPGPQHNVAPTMVRTTVELDTGDEDPIVLVSSTVLALTPDRKGSRTSGFRPSEGQPAGRKNNARAK